MSIRDPLKPDSKGKKRRFLLNKPEFWVKDEGEDGVSTTEQDSERKKIEAADLMVLPTPAKSLQNGAGFSGHSKRGGLSATK